MNATSIRPRLSIALLAITAFVGLSGLADRATSADVTFAQFQQNLAGKPFTFINTGATSTFASASTPVNFQFLVPNGYGLVNQNIAAMLTLSAVVDGTALTAGSLVDQSLKQVQLSIVANTPVGGNDLLLRVDVDGSGNSTAHLSGLAGGRFAMNAADTGAAVASKFSYSSDFVGFVSNTSSNYALSFSSILPSLLVHANGYLSSFTGSGTGTFAATIVPEPGTAGLVLAGFGIVACAYRRRSARQRSCKAGKS